MEYHESHEPYYQLQEEVAAELPAELPVELAEDAHLC